MDINDIVFVSLWIQSMADFSAINQEYVAALSGVTPSRACVAVPLPDSAPVAVEVAACKNWKKKSSLHVQSISHWAPANIGPYSQAVKVDRLVFVAGQIPLVPGSMTLLDGDIEEQVTLAARHISRILNEFRLDLEHAVQITVAVSNVEYLERAVVKVKKLASNSHTIVVGLVVSELPRYSHVEILVVASEIHCESSTAVDDSKDHIHCVGKSAFSKNITGVAYNICVSGWSEKALDELKSTIRNTTSRDNYNVAVKVLYDQELVTKEQLSAIMNGSNINFIPVVRNENKSHFTVMGLGILSI